MFDYLYLAFYLVLIILLELIINYKPINNWSNEKVLLIITFRIGKVTKGKTG